MRRSVTTPLISLLVVIAIIAGWRIFAQTEATRYYETQKVAQSHSEIHLRFTVRHVHGPFAREEYRMQDIDGVSSAAYAVTDRNGTTARFSQPIRGYDVTFLFEKLVQDGIWELRTKPPRGNTDTSYDVDVSQVVNGAHGSHEFRFTDPHYWATTGGQQYRIRLDPNKPVPDLLTLKSTSIAEPRYGRVVADFTDFGPPAFRSTVARARERAQRG